MTTTVKAADAAQFLALVPRILGYTPTRSMVVIPMGRGRSLGAMRIDLPPEGQPLDAFAATVIGMVCRISEADSLVVVAYTEAKAEASLPHDDLAAAIGRSSDASGLRLVDVLVVAPQGWGSHLRASEGVRPISDLLTALPAGLPEAHGDQATGAQLPAVNAAERRRTGAAHRSLRSALAVLCGVPWGRDPAPRVDPAALEAACELDDLPRLFERSLGWEVDDLAPMRIALLGWCLARPALRDVALVQWASDVAGGEDAMEAQRRWEDGEEYPADLAAVMWGEGARPDPQRLECALRLVRQVAARTAKSRRAGSLAVCAWLSWALGRSTHAEHYAREALALDSGHGLAEIVRSFVLAAHLPDWAFDRSPA